MTPTPEDMEAAREAITDWHKNPSKSLAECIAAALAKQREKDAGICDALAAQAQLKCEHQETATHFVDADYLAAESEALERAAAAIRGGKE